MSRRLLVIVVLACALGCASSRPPEVGRLPEGGWIALAHYGTNPVIDTAEQSLVRVGLAADRASYMLVHHFLSQGVLPPAEVVRVEDCITALAPAPRSAKDGQLRLSASVAPTPFHDGWHTLVIAIAGGDRGEGAAPTVVSETPDGSLEKALSALDARIVSGGVAQLAAAFESSERVILVSDGAGLGGVEAQAPLLAEVAAFHQRGGVLSVVARLGPGMDDALLDHLALVGGGTHDAIVPGEERHLAEHLLRGPGLTNALAELRFDPSTVLRWRLLGHESRTARPPSRPSVGGFIPAGEGAYVAVELKLAPGVVASSRIGTVLVASDQASLELPLAAGVTGDVDAHRAVVTIAAFAEKLRGSYFGKDLSWELIAREAAGLATPALRSELGDLVERARSLWTDVPGIERPAHVMRRLP